MKTDHNHMYVEVRGIPTTRSRRSQKSLNAESSVESKAMRSEYVRPVNPCICFPVSRD